MRPFPAFRVRVSRFGAWRAAVAALIAGTIAVQGGWLAGRAGDLPLAVAVAAAAFDVAVLFAAALAWRVVPVELSWDTRRWQIDGNPGNLAIAVDLGGWMLLRFHPHPPMPRRPRTAWLPVQRRGLESHWHALRCAVYCARPALGTDAGPNSAAGPESQE